MDTLHIRRAQPKEHDLVGTLTVAAYESIEGMPLGHYRATLRDVASRAADAEVLVAVDASGQVLGAVTYVPGPDSGAAEFSDGDAAGIRFLAVDPDAQGRGVGRALVEACLERAHAAGRARVVLHSTRWMADAMRLYERLGFVREAGLDWEPEPGVALLGYVCELG